MLLITQLTRTINANSLLFPQWTTNLLTFAPIFFYFPSAEMEKWQKSHSLHMCPEFRSFLFSPRPLLLDYQLHSLTINLSLSAFWIVSVSLQIWPISFSRKPNKQNFSLEIRSSSNHQQFPLSFTAKLIKRVSLDIKHYQIILTITVFLSQVGF